MEIKVRIILLLFLTFSCIRTNKAPDYLIPKDTLIDILIDMHICEAVNNIPEFKVKLDSISLNNLYKSVLIKHKTDKNRFLKTLNFYIDNPKLLNDIYEEAIQKLEKIRNNDIDTLNHNL